MKRQAILRKYRSARLNASCAFALFLLFAVVSCALYPSNNPDNGYLPYLLLIPSFSMRQLPTTPDSGVLRADDVRELLNLTSAALSRDALTHTDVTLLAQLARIAATLRHSLTLLEATHE